MHEMIRWNEDSVLPKCETINCSVEVAGDGATRCWAHGGSRQVEKVKRESRNLYVSQVYQKLLDDFSEGEEVKSLRSEIGLLRVLMQNTLNMCENEGDVLMHSSRLADFAVKLEKLITSCHRLETRVGQVLDKGQCMAFAQTIVDQVAKYVKEESDLETLSGTLIEALTALVGTEEN